ncbi:MAG: hypothetical protein R6U84_07795 [Candidatus Cloacimonadales bacterium]
MTILQQQNIVLKIVALVLALLITAFLELNNFYLLFGITLFYLCLDLRLYRDWLKLILKLLPFFSSLLFISILLPIDLPQQIILILKISYLLLLSVYITKTSELADLLLYRQKNQLAANFIDFLIITLNFIPIFYKKFSEIYQQRQNLAETFSLAVSQTYEQRDLVLEKSELLRQREKKNNAFWSYSNNLLWLFISLQIVLFSVKY